MKSNDSVNHLEHKTEGENQTGEKESYRVSSKLTTVSDKLESPLEVYPLVFTGLSLRGVFVLILIPVTPDPTQCSQFLKGNH